MDNSQEQYHERRYYERLLTINPPGSGLCHRDIMSLANHGILAGISAQRVFDDIRRAIPHGSRPVTNREITDTIDTALRDAGNQEPGAYRKPEPAVKNGAMALRRILDQAISDDEADVWESSPIRIDWPHQEDTVRFLETVFKADDLVFIGNQLEPGVLGVNIRSVSHWLEYLHTGGTVGPLYIVNPLTGEPAPKRGGDGISYRSDSNVKRYCHALIEFDNLPMQDQLRFWLSIRLPVVSLVDSGGKSIHGLLDVTQLAEVGDADAWSNLIKYRLYKERLEHLGIDVACSNPARMSRLPGVKRPETKRYQRLLWLSPVGQEVRHD